MKKNMRNINKLSKIKVIGFDADDTLWENEDIFLEAQNELKIILKKYVDNLDDELFKTEQNNLELYGYGIKGFILSVIETSIRISNGKLDIYGIEKILNLGKEMLSAPVTLIKGVRETLNLLSKQYTLVLITKGDLLDQENKIKNSKLSGYFESIEIVSEKNKHTYRNILKKINVKPENFLMVGNSLKSDILPVLEIGGEGAYIPYKHTWEHEKIDMKDYSNFLKLENISNLTSVF